MTGSPLGVLRSSLRKAVDRYPLLTEPIGRVWYTYEYVRFTYAAWRHERRYGNESTPVDPHRIIWIDPSEIKYRSPANFQLPLRGGDG